MSFSDSEAFGVWFIQSSMGMDLSAYAPGVVSFDIKVDDYGDNDAGMTMKIDCIFPCSSGDQSIGKVGDGDWETVQIPVAQLLGAGLNLATVNTGIVIFPKDQSIALTFQLDNIQWLSGEGPSGDASAVELYRDSVADGWFLWDCCGGATFGEVDDDAEHGRAVELSFGATGTVTGFQAVEGVDVSALASGTLEFDFKQVSPPPAGSLWRLKLESSNAATAVEVVLTHAGNPEPGAGLAALPFHAEPRPRRVGSQRREAGDDLPRLGQCRRCGGPGRQRPLRTRRGTDRTLRGRSRGRLVPLGLLRRRDLRRGRRRRGARQRDRTVIRFRGHRDRLAGNRRSGCQRNGWRDTGVRLQAGVAAARWFAVACQAPRAAERQPRSTS